MNNFFTYTAYLINGDSLPTFINFDDTTLTFNVQSTDFNDAKIYEVVVNASLSDAAASSDGSMIITIEVIRCDTEYLNSIQDIENIYYSIGDSAYSLTTDAIILDEPACEIAIVYEILN